MAPILLGPASPRDLADLMTGGDRQRAEAIAGYRGIPVSELARALVGAGLDVELVTTAEEVDAPMTLGGNRLRLHIAPMRSRARHLALDLFRRERRWLVSMIEAIDGTLVHAHWTYEFAWAALDGGRPVVVTAHDAPLTILRNSRDAYRATRTAMAYLVRLRVRNLTAVSPYLADRWRREMGYWRPIDVIPNSAPALPSTPKPITNGVPRILDVSHTARSKNVASLVRAFRLLRTFRPELELDLVGPGLGEEEAFQAAMADEGSCRGIRFLGELDRDELAATLAGADVFAHPSRQESCPMVVLEAMLAGTPVIAGKSSGGTPWMLDGGRAGMLVDVEDPSAIARAIVSVLDDHQGAREVSRRARQRVEDVFSPHAVASAYIDVYERLLAGTK